MVWTPSACAVRDCSTVSGARRTTKTRDRFIASPWVLAGRPIQHRVPAYLTCTTSFILGWMWQRTSKVPLWVKAALRFSPGDSFLGIEQVRDIDLMDELVIVGEGQGVAAVDCHLGGTEGAPLACTMVWASSAKARAGARRAARSRYFIIWSPPDAAWAQAGRGSGFESETESRMCPSPPANPRPER